MTVRQIDDLEAFKARARATWMAGDYPRVARLTERAANEFIARLQLKPGMKVLDVACGSGNLAIPAAKAGAIVTGIDIAPNLLDQARARAAGETLDIRFEEGDAEDLPFEGGAFDVVVSMFGAMFAPRPEVVAGELTRVCRHGGRIALASWTPSGFIGELFRVTGRHVPPPAGVPSPLLWGDEAAVRERLGNRVADIGMERILASLEFPFSVPETIEFYRIHYGPTLRAFAGLSEAGQAGLRRDLEDLYVRHNENAGGTTSIAAEYLEVIATRA
ncbi:MAG TPA: methyltransferase domain-containing protein [Acetobacteraceae bacterium]|jgi:SAM-dependent methyltransferase